MWRDHEDLRGWVVGSGGPDAPGETLGGAVLLSWCLGCHRRTLRGRRGSWGRPRSRSAGRDRCHATHFRGDRCPDGTTTSGTRGGPVSHLPRHGWDGGEPHLQGSEHSELRWVGLDRALTLPLAHPGYGELLSAVVGYGDVGKRDI